MSEFISTIGLQTLNARNLMSGQISLSNLNNQLATGKKSLNLTDYSSSDAQNLMNLSTSIGQREGFLSVANNIQARLTMYDKSLSGIEKIASEANTSALQTSTYSPEQNNSFTSQLEGCMRQITYYLDQKVGDRYLFAGSRFSTVPVGDISRHFQSPRPKRTSQQATPYPLTIPITIRPIPTLRCPKRITRIRSPSTRRKKFNTA